ncbi:MAG TPA: prephenate dehydratase domain-containing protein [Candidatus Limnocylindrales bacterium]|nr:prephenate dehydratase domain-containing protein [Candidatus Limnocylindrales bacterium]
MRDAVAPLLAHAGEPGSFGEDAALAYRPDCRTVAVATFRDVFLAVAGGAANGGPDGGVVPIENVSQGTVRDVYDLLLEHRLVIVGEAEVPVRLCLAALPGQALDQIERVYSHVQALAQAEPFLRRGGWTLLATATTASAGADLVRRGETGAAAVLSPRAARLHGLEVLAADIQDGLRNRTRFLVLAREAAPAWVSTAGARLRTTLAFGVANEPGTLLRVLSVFAAHGLNMSKLESRPSRERDWEYVFLADLDADLCAAQSQPILEELRAVTASLRLMGCYPVERA